MAKAEDDKTPGWYDCWAFDPNAPHLKGLDKVPTDYSHKYFMIKTNIGNRVGIYWNDTSKERLIERYKESPNKHWGNARLFYESIATNIRHLNSLDEYPKNDSEWNEYNYALVIDVFDRDSSGRYTRLREKPRALFFNRRKKAMDEFRRLYPDIGGIVHYEAFTPHGFYFTCKLENIRLGRIFTTSNSLGSG